MKTCRTVLALLLAAGCGFAAGPTAKPATVDEAAAGLRAKARKQFETVSISDPESARLFQEAADKGDPLAVMWLARLTAGGRAGFASDERRAAELARSVQGEIKRLAETGDAEAQGLWGYALQVGLGVEQDAQKAFPLLASAAKQGEITAMCNLAILFMDGSGTGKNETKAFAMMKQSAEKGYALAQANLGHWHRWGLGSEPDLELARQWYRKAIAGGCDCKRDLSDIQPQVATHNFRATSLRALPLAKMFGCATGEVVKTIEQASLVPAGTKVEVAGPRYAYRDAGLELGLRFGRVQTLELYAAGTKGFKQYQGELPCGLKWTDEQAAVRAKLGEPDDQGDVATDSAYGMAYQCDNLTLAVMFSYKQPGIKEQPLKLIRVMRRWPDGAKDETVK
jgi:hypothetical protein